MQSNQTGRWAITALMWLGAIAISISSIQSPYSHIDIPLVISMAMLFATIGTFLLWGVPEIARIVSIERQNDQQNDESTQGKAKRGGSSQRIEQLALLLELMDEDEVADFKETLKQRVLDGMDDSDMLDTLRDESQTGKRLQ